MSFAGEVQVNLTKAGVILKKNASAEKIPPSYWHDVGSTKPGQGALDCTRKHTEQAMEQATK